MLHQTKKRLTELFASLFLVDLFWFMLLILCKMMFQVI